MAAIKKAIQLAVVFFVLTAGVLVLRLHEEEEVLNNTTIFTSPVAPCENGITSVIIHPECWVVLGSRTQGTYTAVPMTRTIVNTIRMGVYGQKNQPNPYSVWSMTSAVWISARGAMGKWIDYVYETMSMMTEAVYEATNTKPQITKIKEERELDIRQLLVFVLIMFPIMVNGATYLLRQLLRWFVKNLVKQNKYQRCASNSPRFRNALFED